MDIEITRNLWGFARSLEDGFADFKKLGYDGIDAVLPVKENKELFRALLRKYNFIYIVQIGTTGKTVKENIESFRSQLQDTLEYEPFLVNSHSGKDFFSSKQAEDFFSAILEIEKKYGVTVVHETHRSRVLYNPWITEHLIDSFDNLKLCCDFSHWVNVCERLIDDQIYIVEKCAERCCHIHARVGYEHGPQVSDPRAPEYEQHVKSHEKWWDIIFNKQHELGSRTITLTPEFGPPMYQQTVPYTKMPLSDLEEICNYQAMRQRERFKKLMNQ